MLIYIPYQYGNGASQCFTFEDSGKYFRFVSFSAACGRPAPSGASPDQIAAYVLNVQSQTRRAAVYYTA
jgi:hypothetical protein